MCEARAEAEQYRVRVVQAEAAAQLMIADAEKMSVLLVEARAELEEQPARGEVAQLHLQLQDAEAATAAVEDAAWQAEMVGSAVLAKSLAQSANARSTSAAQTERIAELTRELAEMKLEQVDTDAAPTLKRCCTVWLQFYPCVHTHVITRPQVLVHKHITAGFS